MSDQQSKKSATLSRIQTASYEMARALLVFDAWHNQHSSPVELERAMLIDFSVEYPRSILKLVPSLKPVMRAYGLEGEGLADLFAHRWLEARRERFIATIVNLIARGLIHEVVTQARENDEVLKLEVTPLGRSTVAQFTSPLSSGIHGLARILSAAWHKKAIAKLFTEVRSSLPDSAKDIADLTAPFTLWEEEATYFG